MTPAQKRISNRYLLYRLLTHMWFIGAVWLYFYRLYIDDRQIGLLDGLAFAIGIIAEIPSGVLADKYGRDRLVRLGQLLAGLGILLQAFGGGFSTLFIGQSILMTGVSFASGADEALFFDSLNFEKGSLHWRKLVTKGSQFGLVGSLTATVIGGFLHSINPHLPWIMTGLVFLSTLAIIWPIRDKRSDTDILEEATSSIADLKKGFGHFRSPSLWIYVPVIITVQGLFYATGWGLLRLVLLGRFGFSPFAGSIVVAGSSLCTVLILHLLNKRAEKLSEKFVLTTISVVAITSLFLSIGPIGKAGALVILAFYVGEHVLYPFMSEILNNLSPQKQRATILSIASFLRMIPYVALAPIIGYLNQEDRLEYFLVTWAILMVVAVFIYLRNIRKESYISLSKAL